MVSFAPHNLDRIQNRIFTQLYRHQNLTALRIKTTPLSQSIFCGDFFYDTTIKKSYLCFACWDFTMTLRLLTRNVSFIVLIFLLGGCQTIGNMSTKSDSSTNGVSRASYSIFFNQGDHLAELLDAGDFQNAAVLYEEQKEFFDARPEKYQESLSSLALTLNNMRVPDTIKSAKKIESIVWPAPVTEWLTVNNKRG